MKTQETKELTHAEEQVMQALWAVGQGYANEIVAAMAEPKPASNTILTIVRILEKKGYVDHETFNRRTATIPLSAVRSIQGRCWGVWQGIISGLRSAAWCRFWWTGRTCRLRILTL